MDFGGWDLVGQPVKGKEKILLSAQPKSVAGSKQDFNTIYKSASTRTFQAIDFGKGIDISTPIDGNTVGRLGLVRQLIL